MIHRAASRPRQSSLFLLFALVAVATLACSNTPGGGGDFEIRTYQSGGVLEGPDTSLQAVLDQGKPVVLNFWAGLCPPCRAEMPALEGAWEEHRENVVMLGIDIGPFFGLGSYDDGVGLLQALEVTYPAGNTPDSSVMRDFNLNGLPATFFMLPDGTIVDNWPGSITSGQLNRRINDLVDTHYGDG